jgi:hypothetical protein
MNALALSLHSITRVERVREREFPTNRIRAEACEVRGRRAVARPRTHPDERKAVKAPF